MNFSEYFIRRPVLTLVISFLILLVGFQGFINMDFRQYPELEETVISVRTSYPGASASLIQGFITTPIAKAVSSTENVDYVTSTSAQGASAVQVVMRLGSDSETALTEVVSKLQQVRRQLPREAEDPIVMKGTGRQIQLMFLMFASKDMSPPQLTEYLTRVIQPRLATIPGVADAAIMGAQNFSMRIWLDPILMASRNITAAEVVQAINNANFLASPGKTESQYVAVSIEPYTTLSSADEFGALPLRGSGDDVIRLRDIARVELGSDNDDIKVSFNNIEGVFIGISPTPAANPLQVARLIKQQLPQIEADLPEGMTVNVGFDQSIFVEASIREVFVTIAEAVLIVIIVIFLFLGSLRSVLIPIVTIPLSLIGVCSILYAVGFSINMLTLLAMVLAIGLVVDDAIVVVENIHRHIEMDEKPLDAAIMGMRDILSAILGMTITLAAVYAPIAFMQGLTGALFREFAVALAGAVLISGFIAITLSPMMSSRFLKSHEQESETGLTARLDRLFEGLSQFYGRILHIALNARPAIVGLVLTILATTAFLFVKTPSELAPREDAGNIFGMVSGPRYATADYTARYVKQLGAAIGEIPEVELHFSMVGAGMGMRATNTAMASWILVPWQDRDRSSHEVLRDIQRGVAKITGAEVLTFTPSSLPGAGGGLPVQFVLRTIGPPSQVFEVAEEIKRRALATGKFMIVQNSASFDLPNARVTIDRDRAAALGTPVSDIGTTLNILLSEARIARFDRDNRSYDIIPQIRGQDRLAPDALEHLYVRSHSGAMVPLSAVIKINNSAAPVAIEQFNQLNSTTLSVMPMPSLSMDEGLQALNEIADEVMPDGFFVDYTGESRLSLQEGNSLAMAFALSLLVIYLVLAAQFESFRDPFVIIMAVPPSIFGAMIFLNLGFSSLNIYTQVGLITLVGLITKHGILIVQFANARKLEGKSKREAVEEAARVRLRPILMTTAAMVMGVLPLVFASGAGAEARHSIGLVIASGVSIGTLFTLFVVPTFYTLLSRNTLQNQKA